MAGSIAWAAVAAAEKEPDMDKAASMTLREAADATLTEATCKDLA